LPFCHSEFRRPRPKPQIYPNTLNTLGDHLRKRRLDLGLLQKQVADEIGVDETTICNWEGNKSSPSIRSIPKIMGFLGYNPFPPAQTIPEHLITARKLLGLSQRKLAETLGVDPTTLQSWEAERHRPAGRSVEIIQAFLGSLEFGPR
jgi:transcriptional regulator with XRE-family HTH domain